MKSATTIQTPLLASVENSDDSKTMTTFESLPKEIRFLVGDYLVRKLHNPETPHPTLDQLSYYKELCKLDIQYPIIPYKWENAYSPWMRIQAWSNSISESCIGGYEEVQWGRTTRTVGRNPALPAAIASCTPYCCCSLCAVPLSCCGFFADLKNHSKRESNNDEMKNLFIESKPKSLTASRE